MPRFFTVKWPSFAILEAALLFVATLLTCGESPNLRSALIPSLTRAADGSGIPEPALFWTLLVLVVAPPFACAMIAVDRLMFVRKGFAVLSILSVPVWAAVTAALCAHLARVAPASLPSGGGSLAFAWQAAMGGGCASLLIHSRSLWIGLTDRGFVGLRLRSVAATGTPVVPNPRGRIDQRTPRSRRPALWAAAAVVAASIAGFVSYHRAPPILAVATAPAPAARPVAKQSGPVTVHLADRPDVTLPTLPAPAILPVPKEQPAPLPKVWSSRSAAIPSRGGDGEASTKRRSNGYFVVDAEVNGLPVPMLVDTGATMVMIRAEDAERFGIWPDRLKYDVRIWTGNGTGRAAATNIDTLTVGSITRRNVPALVSRQGALRANLLGMSFLRNVREIKVEGNELTLRD